MGERHLKLRLLVAAFTVLAFAGIIYDLQHAGFIEADLANPFTQRLADNIISGENYVGPAFTAACFHHQRQILPFMEQFGLEKLHFFGQEGILAPNKLDLMNRTPQEQECWLQLARRFLELPELLSYSEHAMYIGRKAASASDADC